MSVVASKYNDFCVRVKQIPVPRSIYIAMGSPFYIVDCETLDVLCSLYVL